MLLQRFHEDGMLLGREHFHGCVDHEGESQEPLAKHSNATN